MTMRRGGDAGEPRARGGCGLAQLLLLRSPVRALVRGGEVPASGSNVRPAQQETRSLLAAGQRRRMQGEEAELVGSVGRGASAGEYLHAGEVPLEGGDDERPVAVEVGHAGVCSSLQEQLDCLHVALQASSMQEGRGGEGRGEEGRAGGAYFL
eukprot:768635-Hanusia_phi.AAC.5